MYKKKNFNLYLKPEAKYYNFSRTNRQFNVMHLNLHKTKLMFQKQFFKVNVFKAY